MTSVSEPPTPVHKEKLLNLDDFDTVKSCSDIHGGWKDSNDSIGADPIKNYRSTALRRKRESIASFLKKHEGEDLKFYLQDLRHFAITDGGLIDDDFRSVIWPALASNFLDNLESYSQLDIDEGHWDEEDFPTIRVDEEEDIEVLKEHPEWHQVELDVHRTLARFPPNISDDHRVTLQEDLIPLIVRVLRTNKKFRYYQGFHDVCLTVLLVCGVEKALVMCTAMAHHAAFNNYLLKSLEDSVLKELDLVYVILSKTDAQLEKLMRGVQLGGLFALSWPLTWFSHSLQHYHQIVRCFDFFLATPPIMPIYVASSLLIYRRASIFDCEREMPFIHQLLTCMPHDLPIDNLLSQALYIKKLMPFYLINRQFYWEYKQKISAPPRTPLTTTLSRYTLQFMFVAGTVTAAAGYYYLNKSII